MSKLIIENIRKKFDAKEVLKGASFTFETGKIYGLLGRNGAGKTTLFNCINEDIDIDGGSYKIDEDNMQRAVVSEDIGYVLSTPVVPEFLTAREFLKFFIDINRGKIRNEKTIDEYFEMVSIQPEDQDKLLRDYSHGMKNKMQMLVNFIASPTILLLDEPLTSFDVVVADEMKGVLRAIKKDHIIIFSTHIMELALDLCDEIVILNDGVLSGVSQENHDVEKFKDKIIGILKGEERV